MRVLLQLLVGLALGTALTMTPAEAAAIIAPIVDHHQHLLSPAAAELVNAPTVQGELPTLARQAIKDRETYWNDSGRLAATYSHDAAIFSADNEWIVGAEPAARYVGRVFQRSHRIRIVSTTVIGNDVLVAGYYSAGEPPNTRYFGHAFLQLRREPDGQWRIVVEKPTYQPPRMEAPVLASDLVPMLDKAGIQKAVLLSDAYYFDAKERGPHLEDVQRENDWTADQASLFPGRLVAFCSLNPLAAYGSAEVDRCAASGRFAGLKLHFRASGVDLRNAAQVSKIRAIFAEANRRGLALIIHARSADQFGRSEAETVLQLVDAAPKVPVTIAHLWGGEGLAAEALDVFANAHRPNLYFDVAQIAPAARASEANASMIVATLRRIGLSHVLYGSDGPEFGGKPPAAAWQDFVDAVPLTQSELEQIGRNVAPYVR